MIVLRFLAGLALLTLGRKLYWLFVGLSGFVVAFFAVERFFPQQPEWLILLLGILAGLVGVFLAVFLQRVAVFLAGFLVGGYLIACLLAALNWNAAVFNWVFMLIGGLVCAVLTAMLFDWALILLSSLVGAVVCVQSLRMQPALSTAVMIGLFVVGLAVQAAIKRHDTHSSRKRTRESSEVQVNPPAT